MATEMMGQGLLAVKWAFGIRHPFVIRFPWNLP
jgi:hypothetical protein